MIEIRRYSNTDKPIWDDFVKRSKNATFLHLRDYMDYHADRFADFSLMAFNHHGKLAAVMPANIVGSTLHSHQGLTYGGWLTPVKHFTAVTMLEVWDAMMSFLKENGIRTLVYKAIPYIYHRYPADEDLYALFRHGAQIAECNISTAIIASDPNSAFDRRVRRTLRHAEEEGVVVKASYDYATFWKILSDNLSNKYQAAPVHTLDEIELLHSRFPDNIRLHMAYIGEEAVAGAVMFVDGNVAHAQYSSANERGSATGALCSLFNQLIRVDYADHRYYDFGTSNEQHGLFLNTNLIEMKTGHGGRGVAYQIFKVTIK